MLILWFIFATSAAFASDSSNESVGPVAAPTAAAAPVATLNKEAPERNFYEVLNDVLGDFEYDLKNNNVSGLKELSIRNIAASENIPPSFKNHLELIITEKILKNSKTHVIQCLPCKSRKTSLSGDQVVVTSPETNPAELARIAKLSGIEHYMDVAFQYEPSGIMISMYIVDPESQNIVWSRSYNSESSRASAFRRGVDFNQVDEARRTTEYAPTTQGRLILYYLFQPDLPKTAGCLALGYRLVERYDNRKKEVGFEANYMTNSSTLVNTTGASPLGLYNSFGFNMTLMFLHAWNFIGEEENYNKVRGSFMLGVGGTYASGYLGGLVRASYEWRMAKHFGVSFILGYRPPAAAFIQGTQTGTIGGPEYGLGVNVLF